MEKIDSLRDIIKFNSSFKTSINLYLSLNKSEKVLGYIPTKSSVNFMGDYIKAGNITSRTLWERKISFVACIISNIVNEAIT